MYNEEYDQIKKMFNQNSDQETTYRAKEIMNLDENYQNTGMYNGQNIKEAAMQDHDQIMMERGYIKNEDGSYNLVSFEGTKKVNKKAINKEDKARKVKKTIIAGLVALGLAGGTITFADIANHPENYVTTDDNYQGPVTISQVIDRTPQNFGIGGK